MSCLPARKFSPDTLSCPVTKKKWVICKCRLNYVTSEEAIPTSRPAVGVFTTEFRDYRCRWSSKIDADAGTTLHHGAPPAVFDSLTGIPVDLHVSVFQVEQTFLPHQWQPLTVTCWPVITGELTLITEE